MLLPPTPETAAAFFATLKCGAILLSMSVLYGDDGIRHRVSDSGAKVLVTDRGQRRPHRPGARRARAADRGPPGGAATTSFDAEDTLADDPAQLYYSSGTTGLAKGILHAHRYLLAHEEFVYCHDVQDGELFHGMGEWAWAAGIAPLLGPWRLRRGAARLPARGRLRPAQPARRALAPRRDERLHDADGDALDDGRSPTPARATRRGSASSAARASRSTRRRSAGSASSTASRCSTTTGSRSPIRSSPTTRSWTCARARWAGRCRAGTCAILDEDERPVAQRRARRDLPARALEPALSARLLEQRGGGAETFGGDWFHTKDAARFDEDGYVWYEGRADDVIIAAGYRIGPFEVESACLEHPAVAEAAAVASPGRAARQRRQGVHRRRRGRRAVRRGGGRDQGSSCAGAWARTRTRAGSSSPTRLPKTLTGKIRRIELRQRELQAERDDLNAGWHRLADA